MRTTKLGLSLFAAFMLAAPMWLSAGGCSDDDNDNNNNINDNYNDAGVDADADAEIDAAPPEQKSLTMIITTDLHSHGVGFGNYLDYTPLDTSDNDEVLGGLSRVAGIIDRIRAAEETEDNPVVLIDDGDFFMGTIYDMTAQNALSLAFFQAMGYNATTIGNHEYDWGTAGLAGIYAGAVQNGFTVPVVATNTIFDPDDEADDGLEALKESGVIVEKHVMTLSNGLKIGFLGQMGEQADWMAPTAPPVTFDHDKAHFQQWVDDLRNNDGVDLVVLISHGGLHTDGTGEDADLAGEVDGIDVIASGHFHELSDAYRINDTIVFIPGWYSFYVGHLNATYDMTADGAKLADFTYENILVDDTQMGDATIQYMIDQYNAGINQSLQAALGVEIASPIAEIPFDLHVKKFQEFALGNLVADAIRTIGTIAMLQSGDIDPNDPITIPVAAALPQGVMRDDMLKGKTGIATFADIFNVLPVGMTPDPDNRYAPGWPLISFYLTYEELRTVGEASMAIALAMGDDTTWMNPSGVRYEYDPNGTSMQQVHTIHVCGNAIPTDVGGDGDYFSLNCDTTLDPNDDRLYRVITDLYTFFMLNYARTYGIDVQPKHRDSTVIDAENPADYMSLRIDVDPETAGIQELKSWLAFMQFLLSLPDTNTNGLPDIPEAIYSENPNNLGVGMGRYIEADTPN